METERTLQLGHWERLTHSDEMFLSLPFSKPKALQIMLLEQCEILSTVCVRLPLFAYLREHL